MILRIILVVYIISSNFTYSQKSKVDNCKIKSFEVYLDDYSISEFGGWIHGSIVGITITHNIDLLDKPNGKKVLEYQGETGETFKIKDIYCEWVKIKTNKGIGWVKSEKLCGNPVTTCP